MEIQPGYKQVHFDIKTQWGWLKIVVARLD